MEYYFFRFKLLFSDVVLNIIKNYSKIWNHTYFKNWNRTQIKIDLSFLKNLLFNGSLEDHSNLLSRRSVKLLDLLVSLS